MSETLIPPPPKTRPVLPKTGLGLAALTAIVVGSMIGSGIFALPSQMAGSAAPGPLLIGWAVTGVGMLMLAFVFQTLASRKPEVDGGVYGYARAGFGNYIGFTSAFGYWMSAWVGNVAYLVLLFSTLGYFFPAFEGGATVPAIIGASVVLWIVHAMTLRGIQTAAFVNVVVTIAKVVPILVFIAIAAVGFKAGLFTADFWGKTTQIDGAPLGDTMTQVKNMMLVTVWVFIGIEGAAVYSQRAAKRSDVGRATVLGFAGVLALLLLVNLLSYGLMAQADLAGVADPSMAGVLENEVGSWGAAFISIGLVISLLGALIAWVMLCVEILRLPAIDNVMPKALARENKHGAPANALWLTNLCVQALLLWTLANESTYTNLVYLATSLILLPYLWSAAYQVLLAVRGETYESGRRRTRDLIIGVVALGYAVWLVYAGGWQYLLIAALFYLAGHRAVHLGPPGKPPARLHQSRAGCRRRRHVDIGRGGPADGHRQPVCPVIGRKTMNTSESQLGVWSEAGRLRRVMVCAPGLAHQRLTPENCNELLFDDVIWLQQARRDHFDFVAKMVDRGVEVLELQDLLAEVVALPEARRWLLDRKVTDDLVGSGLTHEIRAWLSELPAERLAEFLIGGVAYQDVPDEVAGSFLSAFRELDPAGFVLRPLPNTQFMRDNTAWIFHGSRPGGVLTLATFSVVAAGVVLTVSPLAHGLGFTPLPWQFTALVALTVAYLLQLEVTKTMFYAEPLRLAGQSHRTRGREHRVHRRAARFSHPGRLPSPALPA